MYKCDIGIYGLGIMGQNLALNFANKGFSVAVFNRRESGEENFVDSFISTRCEGRKVIGYGDLKEFVGSLKAPRKILIMVKAGYAVDEVLNQLIPFLEKEDIVIDGGNSHYKDTAKRVAKVEHMGLHFVGCGISGGGEGALNGPSLMPGGSVKAWEKIKHILQAVAAKCGNDYPCCDWIGPEGSGHFVKMVHNGIEYALMQILAESYDLVHRMLCMSTEEISRVMSEWHKGELHSYLLGITDNILKMADRNGSPLVEKILDCAEQKGTGKDISIAAMELGVPTTTISEAINGRFISCMVSERQQASKNFRTRSRFAGDRNELLKSLHDAIYCSQFIAYAQGFLLIAIASHEYNWGIDLAKVARLWKRGTIIQSKMLDDIAAALGKKELRNVLLEAEFISAINNKQDNWRSTVISALQCGIPVPVMSSALSFFDSFRSECLPASLIQAQRDYFGAHGFEMLGSPSGTIFHLG